MTVLDFDRRQYFVLLKLLRELGERRELTSQIGLDASALGYMRYLLLFLGGLVSMAALGHPPARGFELSVLSVTAMLLVPMMVSEATDAFMNPAEASVLAPRPIRGSTYLAAKVTYVGRAALMIALPFNAIPALAGLMLTGAPWFYPITHLIAAAATGLFTALVACGCFGVLFRILPIASLRTAAAWSQILALIAGPLAPQLLSVMGKRLDFDLDAPYWSAVPMTWFASIGLIGHPGRPSIDPLIAAPPILVSLLILGIGATALSQNYMTRVVMLMRVRRMRSMVSLESWTRAISRVLPGSSGARAGAAFTTKMALRDWQFRRAFLQSHVSLVMLTGLAMARSGLASPFATSKAVGAVQMLPHLNGIIMASACLLLPYTDYYKAAWIFLVSPGRSLLGFARGMFWALWSAGIALPHLVLLMLTLWRWGWHDALIFSAYSLAVASFYLGAGLWMAGGLPFVKPPRATRAAESQGTMIALMILAAVLITIQAFFVLVSVRTTLIAIPIVAAAAAVTAWASLRVLAVNVRMSLDSLTGGDRRMFGATTRDQG